MSTADHILDQIDNTLHDWTVSDDAMRSAPDATTWRGPGVGMAIMDEVGEWQEVGGVSSIDFHIEPPAIDPEFQRAWQQMQEYIARAQAERARQARALLEMLAEGFRAMKPAVEEAARNITKTAEALQHVNPPLPPGQRRDRPAWQSPYGPPRRRR